MIDSLFGSLFGGASGQSFTLPSNMQAVWANQQQAAENARLLNTIGHSNVALGCHATMYELPAGIVWERTGGKTHRVTIRREPEFVPDCSSFGYYVPSSPLHVNAMAYR